MKFKILESFNEDINDIVQDGRGEIVDFLISGGFILEDGTIIEIGEGQDHRLLDIDYWTTENIITYRLDNNYITVRVTTDMTWNQTEVLNNLSDITVYCDIYDKNDKLVLTINEYCPFTVGNFIISKIEDF